MVEKYAQNCFGALYKDGAKREISLADDALLVGVLFVMSRRGFERKKRNKS